MYKRYELTEVRRRIIKTEKIIWWGICIAALAYVKVNPHDLLAQISALLGLSGAFVLYAKAKI